MLIIHTLLHPTYSLATVSVRFPYFQNLYNYHLSAVAHSSTIKENTLLPKSTTFANVCKWVCLKSLLINLLWFPAMARWIHLSSAPSFIRIPSCMTYVLYSPSGGSSSSPVAAEKCGHGESWVWKSPWCFNEETQHPGTCDWCIWPNYRITW